MNYLKVLKSLTALYVEDDAKVREQTAEVLRVFFRELLLAENGGEALALFESRPVHLIIADIKMPVMSGLELATEIRRRDRRLPIFITSSYAETGDLMQAVRLNLIDYLTKPLSYSRLKETLAESARRLIDDGSVFVQINGGTSYCVASGELQQNGETITLTAKESALLALLVRHRGQPVSKERIADVVWSGDPNPMSEPALKNLVLKLRKKVGRELIVNNYNLGYVLRSESHN